MSQLPKINIKLDDKPLLQNLLKTDEEKSKEIIDTFVSLIEISLQNGWDELPQKILREENISFKDFIHGLMFGVLDMPNINPDLYHIMGASVHPLAVLGKQNNYTANGGESMDWREWFMFPSDKQITKETISEVIQKMFHYGRWIDFKGYYDALVNDELSIWKSAEQPQAALLAIQPALKYQVQTKGELSAGDFLEDTGFFHCGIVGDNVKTCPACKRESLTTFNDHIKVCHSCNAGFTTN